MVESRSLVDVLALFWVGREYRRFSLSFSTSFSRSLVLGDFGDFAMGFSLFKSRSLKIFRSFEDMIKVGCGCRLMSVSFKRLVKPASETAASGFARRSAPGPLLL